ncbi:MAG: hypothetical protein QXN08_01190 [Nitrososphaerales archaeon]
MKEIKVNDSIYRLKTPQAWHYALIQVYANLFKKIQSVECVEEAVKVSSEIEKAVSLLCESLIEPKPNAEDTTTLFNELLRYCIELYGEAEWYAEKFRSN